MSHNAPAFILAAGRGERMRPLTDTTPKPLLHVQGKPLLQWHVDALRRQGVPQLVVNTAWLGEQVQAFFDSTSGGIPTHLSHEQRDFGHALETAGGIARALPLLQPFLGDAQQAQDVFWLVAGDVFAPEFAFSAAAVDRFEHHARQHGTLAHIWLVPNPAHHPKGDFGLDTAGFATNGTDMDAPPRLTYSTIGLYRAALFQQPWCAIAQGNPQGEKMALGGLLRRAIDAKRVTAEVYNGTWVDVGTPDRLAQLNRPKL
jgi:MurNAc alpha-1-phosphate uridylyltransferase